MRDKDEIRKDVWQSMRDAGRCRVSGGRGSDTKLHGLGAGTSSASRVGCVEERPGA